MWDLYYEHQNKWLRYGNLYLMMIGFGYFSLWLSVILFAFVPSLVHSNFFKKHTEIRGFLEGGDHPFKLKNISKRISCCYCVSNTLFIVYSLGF